MRSSLGRNNYYEIIILRIVKPVLFINLSHKKKKRKRKIEKEEKKKRQRTRRNKTEKGKIKKNNRRKKLIKKIRGFNSFSFE